MKKLGSKIEGALPKSLTGPLRRGYERLKDKGPKYIGSLASKGAKFAKDTVQSAVNGTIRMYVEDLINDAFGEDIEKAKEKAKQIWMEAQEYIMSFDPVSVMQLHKDLVCMIIIMPFNIRY